MGEDRRPICCSTAQNAEDLIAASKMDDVQGTILYLATPTCHGMAKSRELLDKAVALALTAKNAVKNGEKIKRLVKKSYRAYHTAEIVECLIGTLSPANTV
jgi:hypothetical protein